jgi:hypothetical protein
VIAIVLFLAQMGYGGWVAYLASRGGGPGWLGLGVMGVTFAVAGALFTASTVAGIRTGRPLQKSRFFPLASMLMLVGAAAMVLGMLFAL